MHQSSHSFKDNAHAALNDATLQRALANVKTGFIGKRQAAADRLPEFEALRDQARDIKDHTIANLDFYLERFEAKVVETGGHVHWCATPDEARNAVLAICRSVGAKTVTKGKSMVTEEIGLNAFLEANGMQPVETDLGEYIIQLRHEPPSHIIAPAIHVVQDQISEAFYAHHTQFPPDRPLAEPRQLLDEARAVLRERFLEADVGITGANFLIAETGSTVIVTNEGNGDLTQILPKIHIVVVGLEKVVPTLEDATTLLRVLARSATGQEFSSYTTFSTGPRRPGDHDGPDQFHVVLVDNGRIDMLAGDFREALRCIRCGACMNHCPVYAAVGGHAYGWVYPGPIGSIWTPALTGIENARHLPNASTFCGRCESVCPVRIPLPKLLRHWREKEFDRKLSPATVRFGLGLWAFLARRPRLYRLATGAGSRALRLLAGRRGRLRRLPLAGGWTGVRDLPAPQGPGFHAQWRRQRREGGR
ncbi:MAG: LutB/LldF family L-lactate oxidation iron-sulfur protein [Alphaproteobacteria bacterium]